ncbi:amidophosphoribosyltransferase [Endozoicomonas elysicola]|uniref:Amidophosphoribosyltransferase n=1 Tax=Endozoicomonas elysicola TaxID=305900 RepID=A0A081KCR8_9GAMM|nr:amidophosphoribosyltransferase [Endozoicomonas elysicola]KEI71944.1 amidophosphoribosyltransferase [Endozoicomonas elysicola]
MCGIVGISATVNVNQLLFDALTVLQHRGQDAAGMVTLDDGRFFLRKDNGLVKDVFRTRHMKRLSGTSGLGHVRYPTAGTSSSAEAQPFYVNSPYGIALAHNGNLTNADDIKQSLYESDLRHINTHSDSEILLNVFAHELAKEGRHKPLAEDIFNAITGVYQRCEGGYAVVAMINGHGMVGFRDPHGIRPLVYGKRESEQGTEYMFASESVALDALDFELVRDVAPGEAIYIDEQRQLHSHQCVPGKLTPCMFEYVYLARPDSSVDGIFVYQSRLRMGQTLANKILREWPDHDIDVVMPIPDTSRNSALEMATRLGLPYREGFVKNRYIGRTFIMPGQAIREKSVRQKLNAIGQEFAGKNVLLVDDSIVRGTTCEQIVEMARDAGAKKVYFCSAAPAIRYPNVYGIDMPTSEELIAHGRTDEEVGELIGADKLIFQDLEDLKKAVSSLNPAIEDFDCSVFDGHYVAGKIDENYLAMLASSRNDCSRQSDSDIIDLHNEGEL